MIAHGSRVPVREHCFETSWTTQLADSVRPKTFPFGNTNLGTPKNGRTPMRNGAHIIPIGNICLPRGRLTSNVLCG